MKTPIIKKIRPADGLVIRNPQNNFEAIPIEGTEVQMDKYFRQRLAEKEVVEILPEIQTSKKGDKQS